MWITQKKNTLIMCHVMLAKIDQIGMKSKSKTFLQEGLVNECSIYFFKNFKSINYILK